MLDLAPINMQKGRERTIVTVTVAFNAGLVTVLVITGGVTVAV